MIRDATPLDFPAILALNHADVAALSPLDLPSLAALHAQAASHRVAAEAGAVVAFQLALREGASYASLNYRWFCARLPRFLYVDRIVVHAAHRHLGLARALHEDLVALARATDVPVITCEYDLVPPNPASARFHARAGFVEVGTQPLPGGKQVSLQEKRLVGVGSPHG
jgi:hypothetical protein